MHLLLNSITAVLAPISFWISTTLLATPQKLLPTSALHAVERIASQQFDSNEKDVQFAKLGITLQLLVRNFIQAVNDVIDEDSQHYHEVQQCCGMFRGNVSSKIQWLCRLRLLVCTVMYNCSAALAHCRGQGSEGILRSMGGWIQLCSIQGHQRSFEYLQEVMVQLDTEICGQLEQTRRSLTKSIHLCHEAPWIIDSRVLKDIKCIRSFDSFFQQTIRYHQLMKVSLVHLELQREQLLWQCQQQKVHGIKMGRAGIMLCIRVCVDSSIVQNTFQYKCILFFSTLDVLQCRNWVSRKFCQDSYLTPGGYFRMKTCQALGSRFQTKIVDLQ